MKLKKKYDAPDIMSLPEGYKSNTDKERLYLWSAENFKRQVRHKYPTLKPLCLTSKNECGTEKLTMTFLKATILPYSHLFNLDEMSKFISDFLYYEVKEYKGMLWSPTYVLATQIGNSLEISHILVSFLLGFGYRAYVVCGWVDEATSKMDRSADKCPFLLKESSKEDTDSSHLVTKYTPKKPPELKSKYVQFLHKLKQEFAQGKRPSMLPKLIDPTATQEENGEDETKEVNEDPKFFHAWVYIDIIDSAGFFIEATTGERKPLNHPAYKCINSVWNHENYWLNNQCDEEWKNEKSLDLSNTSKWIKFVCDMELPPKGDGQEDSPKRLLNNLQGWLLELGVPRDCFELMYRLGQKSSTFHNVNVEFFAPYLLKDGMVQRYEKLEISRPPQVVHVMEKFRHRLDKMIVRETFPLSDKVIERFSNGRKDRLQEHEFFKVGAAVLGGEAEDVSKYFSASRMDGLTKRVWKDMELIEEYTGRPDNLIHMDVQFVHIEKKFGPAGDARGAREIGRITEKYEMKSSKPVSSIDAEDVKTKSPGRILDTVHGIMERSFDIDGRRILLKFHREKGQIFCKSVEFLEPQERLRPDDVKVYLVDPRDEKPSLRELSDIYKEQMELQKGAIKRVAVIEKEMDILLESRMKELSANDMEVWVFDTKRNTHVQKGRLEQEQQIRKKEESMLDLEIDFLAPYFQRYPDVSSLTRAQAMDIRDECLANIKANLDDKENVLSEQIQGIKEEMRLKKEFLAQDEMRSRRFMANVLETRLARQKRESIRILTQAEKKIKSDPRLLDVLGY
eukprot:04408.XXX_95632_92827_1 [CDS] Oithona nana genome sequencing.